MSVMMEGTVTVSVVVVVAMELVVGVVPLVSPVALSRRRAVVRPGLLLAGDQLALLAIATLLFGRRVDRFRF
jgi:hypothetical protein